MMDLGGKELLVSSTNLLPDNNRTTTRMAEFEKKWYVVRAISGKEKKVKEYIESEINAQGLQDYVGQILIPTEKVYQIRNGKKVSKERSFFPGYVLVEAALIGEVPHVIRNINNVIGFLGAEKRGEPLPLRMSEVNRILGKVDELAETGEELNIPYIIDETVKVIDGPFNGFNGTIEEINEEKKKLKVMVKIFGRKTPVELGYLQVEKEN
jgi:transcription termination/antitermination protein NusG